MNEELSIQNQFVCQHCWYPSLIKSDDFFYCPACESKFTKDFRIIDNFNLDSFNEYISSIVNNILNQENGYRSNNIYLLLDDLGLSVEASSAKWSIAIHHLSCLFSHYEIIIANNLEDYMYNYLLSQPIPPKKNRKRSYPGEFNDYPFTFYRDGVSPFTQLSNESFKIIYSRTVKLTLPFPLHYLNFSKNKKKFFSLTDFSHQHISDEQWKRGTQELLEQELITNSPIKDNLILVHINQIRRALRESGLKESGRRKTDVIQYAINNLSEKSLLNLIEEKRAYLPTPKSIREFRLITYGLISLNDMIRDENIFRNSNKFTYEQVKEQSQNTKGRQNFLKILIKFLEFGMNSSDYEKFLKDGNPPLEAHLAQILALLGRFDEALDKIKLAYKLDIMNNDSSSTINLNHFGSLKRFQLQMELIKSQTNTEFTIKAEKSEYILKMWVALYKRISEDDSTSFLLENYRDIFNLFNSLSRECENKFRDKEGVPRIGEGWVSEVELLNIFKEIFSNDNVFHQASPDWLGLQRLDIFLPKKRLAIEYQGRQHYEPVEFFGGKVGFKKTQERDKKKAELCKSNDVMLICFRYDEPISKKYVIEKLKTNDLL